jgi:23S rRNA (cytidine1920-2'-O)/16S rRNA (cytidine1409-2'-O)-methyltransferase
MPKKQRLDLVMVERAIVPSRAKAQSLIMARRVQVNGRFVDKPGAPVENDDEVVITELEHPYVGRGGIKLQKALTEFGIKLDGRICADIGASTGGFTDVMLRNGASKVYAIDVGYGQLDATLRNDPRVVNRERVNARFLTPADFQDPISFVSIDVSFISLRLILPVVRDFLQRPGEVVALVKPQFEVGKGEVGKGGIVRDEEKRRGALFGVLDFARSIGFEVVATSESPIRGAEGNVEYLAHLRPGMPGVRPPTTRDERR